MTRTDSRLKNIPAETWLETFQFGLKKSDSKKIEIIQAAIRLIAEKGVERASLEEIGKAVGFERSHLIYYFKSKDDIFDGVIRMITSTGRMTAKKVIEKEGLTIKAYVNSVFDWVEEYPAHAKVMTLFYHYCTYDKKYRQTHTEILAVAFGRIQGIIRNYPELRSNPPPKKTVISLSRAVHTLLFGYYVEYLTSDQKVSTERLRSEATAMIERLLSGNV